MAGCNQIRNGPRTSLRRGPTLIVVQAQPLASELLAQQPVLFLERIDQVALGLVQATGERNQQQGKCIECQTHGVSLSSRNGPVTVSAPRRPGPLTRCILVAS